MKRQKESMFDKTRIITASKSLKCPKCGSYVVIPSDKKGKRTYSCFMCQTQF